MIELAKLAAGHRFQVPDFPASALVIRVIEDIHVSYFFPFSLEDRLDGELKPVDAILIAAHGLQGLPKLISGWEVSNFNPQEWLLPIWVYSTRAGYGPCEADLQMVFKGSIMPMDAEPLDPSSLASLTADYGLAHFGNVKQRLRAILESGDIAAGRVYKLKHYLPDGGKFFETARHS